MNLPPLGHSLPDEVLARRSALPPKPAAFDVAGSIVRLAPLDLHADLDALFAMSDGRPTTLGDRAVDAYDAEERVWRFMSAGPFGSAAEMAAFLRPQVDAANGLALTCHHVPTGQRIGVMNLMNNDPANLKIELGSIWYSPVAQRTGANTEATYLALRHCFDLGYRRVEWKCNDRNLPSREAALKMGFQFEGIQESHFIIKSVSRDTAWYRILDAEWPKVRAALEARLSRGG